MRPSSTSARARQQPASLAAQKQTNAAAAASACGRTTAPGASATSTTGAIDARDERGQKVVVVEAQRVAVGGLGRRRAAARYNYVGAGCRRARRVEVVARYPDNICAVSPERVEDARDAGRDDATGAANNIVITEVPPFHERLGVVDRRARAADDGDLLAVVKGSTFSFLSITTESAAKSRASARCSDDVAFVAYSSSWQEPGTQPLSSRNPGTAAAARTILVMCASKDASSRTPSLSAEYQPRGSPESSTPDPGIATSKPAWY